MLSQLTYTTELLPLFNIDDQHRNNSGQMFSAQWDTFSERAISSAHFDTKYDMI